MKKSKPVRSAKKIGGTVLNATLITLPALIGGGVGAGLGRPALWTGILGLAAANHFRLPDWAKSIAIGCAVNGVATTKPLTAAAQAAEVTVNPQGQLQGFMLIPDDFMTRAEQYYKNIAWSAYLDKVPVVNTALGLSGVENMPSFAANRSARISIDPTVRAELHRLMADMDKGMGNIDAKQFEQAMSQGISGIDAAEFGGTLNIDTRRRTAAMM